MKDKNVISEFFIEVICDMKNQNNLIQYTDVGIWALYAKKGDVWRCVQVAKTENVSREIKADICRLNQEENILQDKYYINQFGEYCFQLDAYPSDKDQLYRYIRSLYDDFIFLHIHAPNEDLLKVESDFAWITKSEFWRNGGSFKKENLLQNKDYYAKVCQKVGITNKMRSEIQTKVEKKIAEFNKPCNVCVFVNNMQCEIFLS